MIHDHKSLNPRQAYGGGDDRLLEKFLPLVRKLAWHLAPSAGSAMDVDDLMQIGMIALTECARRHDRPTDDGLAAYAKLRVRGAMIDAIRKMQVETRSARGERRQIEDCRTALAARLNRAPSNVEMAEAMGISARELSERESRNMAMHHVDVADCYEDSNASFASDEMNGEDLLMEAEGSEHLASALASISVRHQTVIQLYFLEELNLSEIAEVLEVSVPRVHQIKAGALKALRKALENPD